VNHAYGTVLAAAFFGGQTLLHYCLRLLSLWPLAAILDKRHKTPAPGLDRMYVPAEFSSTSEVIFQKKINVRNLPEKKLQQDQM
jgi:hypothetical protein